MQKLKMRSNIIQERKQENIIHKMKKFYLHFKNIDKIIKSRNCKKIYTGYDRTLNIRVFLHKNNIRLPENRLHGVKCMLSHKTPIQYHPSKQKKIKSIYIYIYIYIILIKTRGKRKGKISRNQNPLISRFV